MRFLLRAVPCFRQVLWLGTLVAVVGLNFCAFPALASTPRRPFPQHTHYAEGTIKPTAKNQAELDAAVLGFYRAWKKRYLRSAPGVKGEAYVAANLEGKLDNPSARSISEGHGYGMLATVLMAGGDASAKGDFDALYGFFRSHPTEQTPDLMAWRQVVQKGTSKLVELPEDRDSATDGDLDIAFALLLADQQWGSRDTVNYKAEALKVMAAILSRETDAKKRTLNLGNWVSSDAPYAHSLRPSDFMPTHLRAFRALSGKSQWTAIQDSTYALLKKVNATYSPKTGLFPDFIILSAGGYAPAPPNFLEGPNDGAFGYNACRVPWRIGLDYLLHGDKRAAALLKPLNQWAKAATNGHPERFNAGYTLKGLPLGEDSSAAFIGPLAVAAMIDESHQAWLDALWADLLKRRLANEGYYGNTVKLLTMIAISGNWWK